MRTTPLACPSNGGRLGHTCAFGIPEVSVYTVDDLPQGVRGYWSNQYRDILLRDGMSMVERRSVLAHELSHIVYNHPHRVGRGRKLLIEAQEADADELAARRLIGLAMLGAVVGLATVEAADLLHVTPWIYTIRFRFLHSSERRYLDQGRWQP